MGIDLPAAAREWLGTPTAQARAEYTVVLAGIKETHATTTPENRR